MSRKQLQSVVYLLVLHAAVKFALCQEPLPILELDPPDEADIIRHSKCVDGLVSDLDLFTVRGRVNKNGSNSDAYVDTDLYLQAVKDPNTYSWESQCRPDLNVCGVNLNTDCYCERKDQDGYYHLVMRIVVKSIYSGGKLRLSWNDNRSPQNSSITSNIVDYYPGDINGTLVLSRNETRSPQNLSITSNTVDYYPGNIREKEFVTFKIVGTNGMILDQNLTHDDTNPIPVTYTAEMRNVTFCVFNLATNRSIQIEDGGDILVNTTTDPCVVLDLSETSLSRNLTITFMELEECKREGLFILTLEPGTTDETYEISSLVIFLSLYGGFVTVFILPCAVLTAVCVLKDWRKYKSKSTTEEQKSEAMSRIKEHRKYFGYWVLCVTAAMFFPVTVVVATAMVMINQTVDGDAATKIKTTLKNFGLLLFAILTIPFIPLSALVFFCYSLIKWIPKINELPKKPDQTSNDNQNFYGL